MQTLPDTATLTIDGGAGDDIIVGGPNLDTLRGGEGNDRLTGGPNNAAKPAKESISGGGGNDVIIWNNGDGDDINDGGDGADETQFNNGTADDVMSVSSLGGGAHRFDRVGAAIEIDIAASTERLNVNAFSGADSLAMAAGTTIPTTIDAGPGNDTITTGDGADLDPGRRRRRHAQRRRRRRPHPRQPRQRRHERQRRRRRAGVEQRRRHGRHERRGRPGPDRGQPRRGV